MGGNRDFRSQMSQSGRELHPGWWRAVPAETGGQDREQRLGYSCSTCLVVAQLDAGDSAASTLTSLFSWGLCGAGGRNKQVSV